MEISQNFVAFSEYMNFKVHHYLCGSKFSFLVMQWNKKNYFVFSENQSIKMSTAWQRNLRRSEGTSNLPRAIGIKNQKNNNVGVQARGQFSLVSGLCHPEIYFVVLSKETVVLDNSLFSFKQNKKRGRPEGQ